MTEYLLVFFAGLLFGVSVDFVLSYLLRRYLSSHYDQQYDQQIIKEDLQNLTVKFDSLNDKLAKLIPS